MKTKVAKKAMHHAKPMRKVARGKKHARAAAIPDKKEAVQNVAIGTETIATTFEAPAEYVEMDLQPEVEVIEVFEFAVPGDVEEA